MGSFQKALCHTPHCRISPHCTGTPPPGRSKGSPFDLARSRREEHRLVFHISDGSSAVNAGRSCISQKQLNRLAAAIWVQVAPNTLRLEHSVTEFGRGDLGPPGSRKRNKRSSGPLPTQSYTRPLLQRLACREAIAGMTRTRKPKTFRPLIGSSRVLLQPHGQAKSTL